MFKKSNPGQQETKRAGRVRMDILHTAPKLHDVRMVLVEAQRAKGTLCELPIQMANGTYLLSCQSDHLSPEPCWTLYEGSDGSKQIWSYMNEDLEMITDIVNMSISQAAPQAEVSSAFAEVNNVLSNELSQKAAEEYKPWGQNAESAPPANSWPPAETAASSQWPAVSPAAAQQWPGAAPAPAPAPPMRPQQPMDQSQSQWPLQPGGYPQQTSPPQQWPGAAPAPAPAPAPIDPMLQQSQWPMGYPGAAPAPAPAPAPSASPWLTQQPTTDNKPAMAKFIALLDSKKNLTVGELLFASDLPQSCADSAMRLQEMICKSEITDKAAIEALRLAAERGTGVVDESVLGEIRMRSNASAEAGRAAVVMLKDSGLITEADLNAAEMKAEQEGKDIREMLIANGKSDKLIVDAATKCVEYINAGKLRPEKAIIALHYCQRARAPIDQAFDDLSIEIL